MIKTLRKTFKQDKEGFEIPKGVQDIIPVKKIYEDRFNKPEWIQRFICLRAEAEGIRKGETEHM